MTTPEALRTAAAATVWHVGRSWSDHAIEDGCPCAKAPCGLVVQGAFDPDCVHHDGAATIRQGHAAEHCTGGTP